MNNNFNQNRVSPSSHIHSDSAEPQRWAIVLAGGASHSRYQKEVLVQLLNSELIRSGRAVITHVTGTSGGANNGARLVAGLNNGGPDEAIRLLNGHWREMESYGLAHSHYSLGNAMAFSSRDQFPNIPHLMNLQREWQNAVVPQGFVPQLLQEMLKRDIPDWSHVQNGPCQLFVNACSVDPASESGLKQHVFTGNTLTPKTVTASAALQEFGGLSHDGLTLFDGGYVANPNFEVLKDADVDHMLFIMLDPEAKTGMKPANDHRGAFQRAALKIDKSSGERIAALQADPDRQFDVHMIELQSQPHWNKTTFYRLDQRWMDYLKAEARKDFPAFAASRPDLFPEYVREELAARIAA